MGNWDFVEGGEAFPERGIWRRLGSAGALCCCSPGWVQGNPLSLFLGGTSPSNPLISHCHFLISLLHKNFQQHLTSHLAALAGETGGGCTASPVCWQKPLPVVDSCLFRGPLRVSWGLSPPTPFERLTLLRTT